MDGGLEKVVVDIEMFARLVCAAARRVQRAMVVKLRMFHSRHEERETNEEDIEEEKIVKGKGRKRRQEKARKK